jgi:hypothetical protein
VYVVFSLVILVGGYLVSAEVITPAKYFSFRDMAALFSEKSEVAGEVKGESAATDGSVVPEQQIRSVKGVSEGATSGAESESLSQPDAIRVIANSKSKRYHLPGMKYYDKIPGDRRVFFTSEEAAQRAGYRKSSK